MGRRLKRNLASRGVTPSGPGADLDLSLLKALCTSNWVMVRGSLHWGVETGEDWKTASKKLFNSSSDLGEKLSCRGLGRRSSWKCLLTWSLIVFGS